MHVFQNNTHLLYISILTRTSKGLSFSLGEETDFGPDVNWKFHGLDIDVMKVYNNKITLDNTKSKTTK